MKALAPLQTELAPEAPELPVQLLVAFCRAMIRNMPSRDMIELSLSAAKEDAGASDRDISLLRQALLQEASRSPWPAGFF